jgi:flagellar hook protein FlgE
MSLFGTLNTSISGMAAQASKLSTIGDNIANSSTTGYKRADTEFETLLGVQATSSYESGGVQTRVRYGVTDQGDITSTTSATDLAIDGNGFFVVQDSSGAMALTRAGSFVKDANGNLVNAAGYKLMGYSVNGSTTSSNLQLVNVSSQALSAEPSTTGTLTMNLSSNATAVAAANLPSTNTAGATSTSATTVTAYDNLGNAVTLDVYMTKTGDNTWEATVYNHANAAAGGGFPYSSGPLATQTLSFDGTTGKLTSASASSLSMAIPNGKTVTLDLSKTTQLAAAFAVTNANIDGTAPSKLDHITIGKDGTVTGVYANGSTAPIAQIALANVASPDNLTSLSGDAYQVNSESGPMQVGTADSGNLGKIESSSLESSTVDLATELTNMISAQRGYEANSKVLQTSSDLLSIINNLKV